jgi:predicted nucleotidyltransferase
MNKRKTGNNFQKELKKIVEALKAYQPKKIILFGSMLRSDSPASDIDLFLVKETNLARLGERAREAREFLPNQRVPVDFIVCTPEEIKYEVGRGNVFIAEILEKGRLLYEEKI